MTIDYDAMRPLNNEVSRVTLKGDMWARYHDALSGLGAGNIEDDINRVVDIRFHFSIRNRIAIRMAENEREI